MVLIFSKKIGGALRDWVKTGGFTRHCDESGQGFQVRKTSPTQKHGTESRLRACFQFARPLDSHFARGNVISLYGEIQYMTMREFMAITKALADENRVRVLLALQGGELCVCQITELFGLAASTISKHLSILYQAGLVDSRKDGRWIYYSPARERGFGTCPRSDPVGGQVARRGLAHGRRCRAPQENLSHGPG